MRLLLCTGAGGAGVTTVSAATAAAAARAGAKTLLADLSGGRSGPVGAGTAPDPVELAANLYGTRPDLDRLPATLEARVHALLVPACEELGLQPVSLEQMLDLPPVRDLLALLQVRDHVRTGTWDLVVVDTGAAATALRLVTTPASVLSWLAALLPLERRIGRVLARTGALSPPGRGPARAPVPDDLVPAVDALTEELRSLEALLHDRGTAATVVMVPAPDAVTAGRRLAAQLSLHGLQIESIVANQVFPLGGGWQARRAGRQREVLATASGLLSPVPVRPVPLLEAGHEGLEVAFAVADALHGIAGNPVAATPVAPPAPSTRTVPDGFVLDVPLPLADPADVDAGRRGDDLVISIAGSRRALALPSALRRCTVAGAAFGEGTLSISFEPDPALWRKR